jgi:hypothetical protein
LGLFDTVVGSFRQVLSSLPDKRTGKNTRYGMENAALNAFSVFFTQTLSFIASIRCWSAKKGRSYDMLVQNNPCEPCQVKLTRIQKSSFNKKTFCFVGFHTI